MKTFFCTTCQRDIPGLGVASTEFHARFHLRQADDLLLSLAQDLPEYRERITEIRSHLLIPGTIGGTATPQEV